MLSKTSRYRQGEVIMGHTTARVDNPQAVAGTVDPVWIRLREEAEAMVRNEPVLAGFALSTILQQPNLESAVIHRLAWRLGHPALSADLIEQAYLEAVEQEPAIGQAFRADIMAVVDRDPACNRLLEPVLFFKGFHAIQTQRLAHWLWNRGRQDLALYLQSRSSEVFQTDVHPAARIGRGIFLDHATGLVVGSTAVIEDNVSMLQDVTLGGTGKEKGDRHPKIRRGVLIGAGAKILGNIEIGECARVAAGSVVLQPVPRNATVAGVPAKVVGSAGCAEPARQMDQLLSMMEGI
jgi:serine O-acetyltransferase